MALFNLRLFVLFGPNLISAGLYPLRGWWTLFVWPLRLKSIAIRLPVRALIYRDPTGEVRQ